MNAQCLTVIDADSRRRAAICYSLSRLPVHVEPFESVQELPRKWGSRGPLLVFDDAQAISRISQFMEELGQWVPVVAYAEAISVGQVVSAIKAGAIDYLSWPFAPADVVELFKRVSAETDRISGKWMRERIARRQIAKLSRRETQVLKCMVNGMSNRQTGECIDISWRTVEVHRANLLKKLGASHSSEAIRVALEAGLDE